MTSCCDISLRKQLPFKISTFLRVSTIDRKFNPYFCDYGSIRVGEMDEKCIFELFLYVNATQHDMRKQTNLVFNNHFPPHDYEVFRLTKSQAFLLHELQPHQC